tara:strand:+ start:550 stop:699 length:150 start_codon:yes stop_codon:yes gene_type:complete
MKKTYFIVLLLIFSCSQIEFPWSNLSFSEAQTQAMHNNKMIMVDFYADW